MSSYGWKDYFGQFVIFGDCSDCDSGDTNDSGESDEFVDSHESWYYGELI